MNLTSAQQATIEYFGLEAVDIDHYRSGQWCLDQGGFLWKAGARGGEVISSVVVRPRHAARIAELEAELRTNQNAVDLQRKALESAEAEIKTLRLKNRSFEPLIEQYEAELAPVRALKEGSAEWAFNVLASGGTVVDKAGDQWRIRDGDLYLQKGHDGGFRKANCICITQYGPFTLHTEPPPLPTAEELVVAIEDLVAYFQGDEDEVAGMSKRINRLQSLAARFRKGGGDGR